MLSRAHVDRLVFELVYSLTCDNRIFRVLETLNYVWEYLQLAAFVCAQRVPWNMPAFQKAISYVLLSFQTNANEYIFLWLVLLMDLILLYLLVELHRKGGINSFRALKLCRGLIGIISTSLFFPILKEYLGFISRYTIDPAIVLSEWILAIIVFVFGLLMPVCTLIYLFDYDPRHLTIISSSSSRQQLAWLILKLVITVVYTFASSHAYSIALFVCLLIMLISGFFLPPFLFPITNLLWAGGLSALTSAATFGMIAAVTDAQTQTLFYVSCGISPIVSFVVGSAFVLRVNRLLSGFPIWKTETDRVGAEIRRIIMCRPASKMTYNEAIISATFNIPTKELLPRTRMVLDATLIANTLFATSGGEMSSYIIDYLTKVSKKFPSSNLLRARLIVLSACVGEDTPNHRLHIQNMIRKELKAGDTRLDARYKYYFVMKTFEIDSFRKNVPDIRKMTMLDIVKYHYNLTEARKHHSETLKWALRFWKAVGAERMHMDSLGSLAESVYIHQAAAFHHYCVVLHDFPASITGLRSYAAFASDCINNAGLAQDITELADRIEEERNEPENDDKPSIVKGSGVIKKTTTTEDDKSEKMSSAGRSSDMFKGAEANSIFDITSFDERRNSIAMSNVRRLSNSILMTLALLFFVIVAFFLASGIFNRNELVARDLLLGSGRLRLYLIQSDLISRKLLTDLTNGVDTNSIINQQLAIKTVANAALGYLSTVLYNSTSFTDPILTFWKTNAFDAMVSDESRILTAMAPEDFVQTYILNLLTIADLPVANLSTSTLELLWVVHNAGPPPFFALVLNIVAAYQKSYSIIMDFRITAAEFAIIPIVLLPLISSALLFLPAWRHISLELDAINRLFVKVPRKVASLLVKEMTEKVTENSESIGLEPCEQTDVSGYSDADRDEQEVSGKNKSPIAGQLLFTYLASLVGSFLFVVGMVVAVIYPMILYKQRAALINYSGVRISGLCRAYSQSHQLIFDPNIVNQRDIIRNDIRALIDRVASAHESVLFGDDSLGIPRTIDIAPDANKLTFTRGCSTFNMSCLSIDEAITAFSFRARRLIALNDSEIASGVYVRDLEDMSIIANPDAVSGRMTSAILAVREVYGQLWQSTMDILQMIRLVLIGVSVPAYIAVWLYLRQALSRVSSRIRRTRNLLYQLPEETIKSISLISDYLNFGIVIIDKKKKHSTRMTIKIDMGAFVRKMLHFQRRKKSESVPLLSDESEENENYDSNEKNTETEGLLDELKGLSSLKMDELNRAERKKSVSFHSPSTAVNERSDNFSIIMDALRSNAGLPLTEVDNAPSNQEIDDEDVRSA